MNSPGGAATQICAHRFDRRFFALPPQVQARITEQIDQLGLNLRGYSHCRMQGGDVFRLRAGNYRIIYQFSIEKNELYLIALGHRRDIYKESFS